MLAYLKKSKGSEEFHQIVDFLNVSHIRYDLTKNPTIYVSLIKQLWQTATAKTLNNGEIELTATIDGKVKTVIEGSVRRHLQLADAEIFKQLSLMGSPTQTLVADEIIHEERRDSVERAATTTTSLDVEQGSGNINRTQSTAIHNDPFPQGIGSGGSPMCQDTILGDRPVQTRFKRLSKQSHDSSLLRVNTLGSDEGSMTQQELMGRKIADIDQDPGISLVQHDAKIQGRYEHDMEFDFDFDATKEVSTAKKDVSTTEPVSIAGAAVTTASVAVSTVSPIRNTRVSTADDITMAETLVYIRKSVVKDKAAVRLQAKLEEEKRQRIAKKLQAEERKKYTEAEQARMLAELINQRKGSKRQKTNESSELAEESRDKEVEELSQEEIQQIMIIVPNQRMNVEALQTKYPIINWEIYTEGTRKYWKIIRVRNHTEIHHFFDDMMKDFDRDELVMLWSLVKEKFKSTEPTDDKEREIWVELKRLFELNTDDELWKLQKHIHDLTWKLYYSCGVHHVSKEKGIDIYMLVEKEYPLSRGTLTLILVVKLLVDQDNEISRELLRKIFMQVERPRR
ncbi:hypothetical protein Tco_0479036 [Tanacetum coccineum]